MVSRLGKHRSLKTGYKRHLPSLVLALIMFSCGLTSFYESTAWPTKLSRIQTLSLSTSSSHMAGKVSPGCLVNGAGVMVVMTNNKNPTLFQAHQSTTAGPQPAGKGLSGLFCTFSHILIVKDIRTRTALNCTDHGNHGLAKWNYLHFSEIISYHKSLGKQKTDRQGTHRPLKSGINVVLHHVFRLFFHNSNDNFLLYYVQHGTFSLLV